ncbi:MAG: response regulator transcription factor [Proteobacteria bacterium]|nr:response regulator transcription factor [Pseudomonadota bacterium]
MGGIFQRHNNYSLHKFQIPLKGLEYNPISEPVPRTKVTEKNLSNSVKNMDSLSGFRDKEKSEHPHERLSNREYQIFCNITQGKSTAEISTDLNLSPKTVSTYKTRIFDKMKVRNDAKLVLYAVEKGLIR